MREWRWRDWHIYDASPNKGSFLGFGDRERTLSKERDLRLGVLAARQIEDEEDYRADVLELLTRIAEAVEVVVEKLENEAGKT